MRVAQLTRSSLQITALAPRAVRSVAAPRVGSHAAPPPLALGGGGPGNGAGANGGNGGNGGGKKRMVGFWGGGGGGGGGGNNGSNGGSNNNNSGSGGGGGGRGRRVTSSAGGSFGKSGGGGGGRRVTSSAGGSFGKSGGGGGGGGLREAYLKALERSPLLTKAVTSGVISAAGNLLCQAGVERKSLFGGGGGGGQIDGRRVALFTALGAFYVAPVLHVWYGLLGRMVTATGVPGALGRMALDQLAFAPAFVASMMMLLSLADGQGAAAARRGVAEALPSAVKANWALWVPAQYVNFRYVPANLQVGFSNVVALAWNVYFSFATRPQPAAAVAAAAAVGKGGKKK